MGQDPATITTARFLPGSAGTTLTALSEETL
jgi:hypothetical protein